ncbi:hypothetical protein Q2415_26015, partial [Escherichia coli]|nr:hypothetical protein [Escherichia coli]
SHGTGRRWTALSVGADGKLTQSDCGFLHQQLLISISAQLLLNPPLDSPVQLLQTCHIHRWHGAPDHA